MIIKNLKIISGGQTGVDRAALDFAIKNNIQTGGYCPRGRKAEDGAIPEIYPLIELESKKYSDRTKANVEEADGTLVITWSKEPGHGTKKTIEFCLQLGKPFKICKMEEVENIDEYFAFHHWLIRNHIKVLNIAGNRESKSPGIYEKTLETLEILSEKK